MSASADAELDLNLTPLLDLVLQLIMFFMITVNFVAQEQFSGEIQLPTAQSAMIMDKSADQFIFINLDRDGELVGSDKGFKLDTFGKIQVKLKIQREDIERVHGTGIRIVVVLRADKDCRYRKIHEVLEACQRSGYSHWQMRVMTKPG